MSEVKGKTKFSLCFTNYHAMKMYWGVNIWHHVFLTAALVGEWSASRPSRDKNPRYSFDRRLDLRAGLDAVDRRKNPIILPPGNRTPVLQPVA
jgi:hypothetical protein